MSSWRPQPASDLPDGLILFDGVCVLCSGMVAFVIPRDAVGRFRFVAVQSEAGTTLARRFGIRTDDPEAVAVVSDGMAYFKADAAIAIGRGLPGWRWAIVLKALPRPVRDFLYDRIARNRYRLFGRRESCLMPTPEIRSRFIATLPDLASAA
ncbi:thiol-disulfide oxidoreductase DCC family protein [Labrys sp. (in: a-proteobacteria)]|uniref:thiol-disulfide oxidoreductase DCC family protein n=1 Tax=Labrys sp. (in: a-proteobacteria) TaxID=1917972 RepID=UPI0039E29D58